MDTCTLCLTILQKGAASGYEIKKTLEEMPYRIFQETGFGSIYPALNRLLAAGHVNVRTHEQKRRPDKKFYAITKAGRNTLKENLLQPPTQDRFRSDFLFLIFHAELLPSDRLSTLLDERIAELKATVDSMKTCDLSSKTAGQCFVHGYGLIYYQNALQYLINNRDWLETQTAREHGKEDSDAGTGLSPEGTQQMSKTER